jgi:hypothetical protein
LRLRLIGHCLFLKSSNVSRSTARVAAWGPLRQQGQKERAAAALEVYGISALRGRMG